MRILLANHDLAQLGGTQTWLNEMFRALHMHDVEVFCAVGGFMEPDCKVHIGRMPPDDFDLLIINQNLPMRALSRLSGYKIYTQHGPTHAAEFYPGGADSVVAVSEEVKAVLLRRGYSSRVIRNGINLERFYPGPQEYDVLNLCKGTRGSEMVSRACENMGLSCVTVHYQNSPLNDVAQLMRKSDIVVSYGRGALEGLACGKKVLVFDARGKEAPRADGWVTQETVDELATHNFSGRTRNMEFDQTDLEAALSGPAPSSGREWAEENVDIHSQAGKYLAYVEEKVHG